MFRRFAAASAIASIPIAFACLALVILGDNLERFAALTTAWCMVPAIWGIWAMITPRTWMPERLPQWGALLGFVAGVFAVYILDLPGRVFDVRLDGARRVGGLVVAVVFYTLLWVLVRWAYRSLATKA